MLSELGYLEALDPEQRTLPTGIEEQLVGSTKGFPKEGEKGRNLWFLGYSVSDWNVRLRLYEHLRHSNRSQLEIVRQAVDRDCHSIRMALLGTLDVTVFVGDLNILPSIILAALDKVPEEERSEELERLLDWLTRNRDEYAA